jgi:hypothetical protein
MMKWGFALNAGLGALLVASAMGVQKPGSQDLELSLDRVTRGLEELSGMRARIERSEVGAIADVIARTDAPGTDARADAEHLAQLRFEVSRLQMDWDALAATLPDQSTQAKKPGATASPSAAAGTDGAATAFEAPGFSADPLKQGEALFRAGKYQAAIDVLRTLPDDARCQYWNARALEQLGKTSEAIALYTTVSARKDAGWAGERARTDLELLLWKRDSVSEGTKQP